MKIGVLGGTFDPPHAGHLALAHAAIEALQLDEVLFVPTSRNPHKMDGKSTPAKHRLAMVQALLKNEPKMAACDVEIARGGASYAVDTMTELSMAQPADYWFLAGADILNRFDEWKQPERLLRLCRLAVVIRPPVSEISLMHKVPADFRDHVDLIAMPPVKVSATDIRDRLSQRLAPGPYLAPAVYAYIQQNHLYTV